METELMQTMATGRRSEREQHPPQHEDIILKYITVVYSAYF